MTWTPEDFDYDLPPDRIAQTAVEPRDSSRLLVIHRTSGQLEHRTFRDLPAYLRPGDVLVLNQTRVIPARLRARKIPTGGAVEILLVQRIDQVRWLALVGGKHIRVGTRLTVETGGETGSDIPAIEATVTETRAESQRVVMFNRPVEPYLDVIGQTPLPPYIHTPLADPERYQTIYARIPGSVAAPTAGLHFTPDLLLRLREMGVQIVHCTLHVGPGTFQPVKAEQLAAHRLHAEYAELRVEEAKIINETKLRGGRVIAVGTTSVRTLETAAQRALGDSGACVPDASGASGVEACPWLPLAAIAEPTELFITPGFRFRVVEGMVTNFHLPRSTLLMLVSAFAGRDLMLRAYEVAKQEGYRFYSLGDATLIVD
jgi:S-adenosylmethionine:tRNA ribosyltransferase-isomerase